MDNLNKAYQLIDDADVVVVTAGNGLAKIEGLDLLGQTKFSQEFPEIFKNYGVLSVGTALDLKKLSWKQRWSIWSEFIQKYSLTYEPSVTMRQLKQLLENKEYFIATSTFANFFEKAGFNKKRLFNIFGNWTKMQCSSGVNHGLQDDIAVVQQFLSTKDNTRKLTSLVPQCTVCGQPMEIHLPLNDHFYPDTDANARFRWFLTGNENKRTVFLELGVDETSPQLLNPVLHLVEEYDQWSYVAADLNKDCLPESIIKRSVAVNADSKSLLASLVKG
jgi:NAD-dependent SIR2 family protein deacetylase